MKPAFVPLAGRHNGCEQVIDNVDLLLFFSLPKAFGTEKNEHRPHYQALILTFCEHS